MHTALLLAMKRLASVLGLTAALAACGVPRVFLVRDGSHADTTDADACLGANCDAGVLDARTDVVVPVDQGIDVPVQIDVGVDVPVPVDVCTCPAPRTCASGVCTSGWRTLAPSPLAPRRNAAFALAPERHELLIWGGFGSGTVGLSDGARYDWQADTWTMMSPSPLAPRARAAAVWTGTRLIIWGGALTVAALSDGAIYDPVTNTWAPMTNMNLPPARSAAVAVWTGTQMLVYGGENGGTAQTDGWFYDPAGNVWSAAIAPSGPSTTHAARGWTGSRLLVWGGDATTGASCGLGTNTGGTFAPGGAWAPTASLGAPSNRFFTGALCLSDWYSAPWTGTEFFVWGGNNNGAWRSDGAMYAPGTDTWRALPAALGPLFPGGFLPTAVWTGTNVLGWGVTNGPTGTNVVYTYTPSSNAWTVAQPPGAPPNIIGGPAFGWTGSELIVWGGRIQANNCSNQGGAYLP